MLCPNCGAENRTEARFCRECGGTLVNDRELVNPDTEADVDSSIEPAKTAETDSQADQLLAGRYRLLEGVEEIADIPEEGSILLQAQDLLCCRNCQTVQASLDQQFCEECGAELKPFPLVNIRIGQINGDAPPEDNETHFTKDGFFYQIEEQFPNLQAETRSAMLQVVCGFQSHPGKVRENNEDSLITLQLAGLCESGCSMNLAFFAVADGVGGSASGEIASQTAVRKLAEGVMQRIFTPEIAGSPLSEEDLSVQLRQLILDTNQAILDLRSELNVNDTGSTLTAALIRGVRAVIANVGDSRTYLMRQGKLTQITQDHSMVARLLEQGLITTDELYTHQQRSVIYRSLGSRQDLEVDLFPIELEPGERLMLCSDGIWEMVHDPMIEDLLLEHIDPQKTCDRLIELSNLAGGQDNSSVIVVDLQDSYYKEHETKDRE